MQTVRPDIKKIATISVVLVIMFYSISHYLFKTRPDFIIYKTGIIISGVSLFWLFFDKIGWCGFLRIGGWLCEMPNLNGRFEGNINRYDENNPHKFVMEIKQTYREISINTYSKNSSGNSITANIVKDDLGKFYLFYTWHTRTKNRQNPCIKDDFYGTSIIEISENNGIIHLKDDYFTRRNPPTQGESRLVFISNKLKHRYE